MIRLIFLEVLKLRKPFILVAGLILLLLLSASMFKQFDDPPGLVYLMLSGLITLYAVTVGWKQFVPSRFPVLGDDVLSGRHPIVSVIARWGAYFLTVGLLLALTFGVLWWCLSTPGHTSRPYDSNELLILAKYWLLPLVMLYGFSALIAQKRSSSRSLWIMAGLVTCFRQEFGLLVLLFVSDSEVNPVSSSSLVISVIVCIALYGSVAMASMHKSRLLLNRASSVFLNCLILFPLVFATAGWLAAGAAGALTHKADQQWLPVADTGVNEEQVSFYSVTGNLDIIKHLRGRVEEGGSWGSPNVVFQAGNQENRKAFSAWTVNEETGERSMTMYPVPELLPGDEILQKPARIMRDGRELQLLEAEQNGLARINSGAELMVDIHRGNLLLAKDPDSTQELQWKVQNAGTGTDRLFWSRQQRRFELYDVHQRKLLTHVSTAQTGKFLGYKAIYAPQKRMIVSFEHGVWALNKHGRKLSLTPLYYTPLSQRLLNVVEPTSYSGVGSLWPILTDRAFSVYRTDSDYRSEFNENDRILHLTELPGLKTADEISVYLSQWQRGAVAIMQEKTPGLEHDEILRYDGEGNLMSRTITNDVPLRGMTAFGALVSPVVYSLSPYGTFRYVSVVVHQKPRLKMSAWIIAIGLNIVAMLIMSGLIKRFILSKRTATAWMVCAAIFSAPALLMFLVWMPWRESREKKRVAQSRI